MTQSLHRNLALLSLVLLLAHVTTAVVDSTSTSAGGRRSPPWARPTSPSGSGLGTLALDLMVVLVVTSLLRDRIRHRLWRGVHWLGVPSWAVSMTHGLGIGTDADTTWGATWASPAWPPSRCVRRGAGSSPTPARSTRPDPR